MVKLINFGQIGKLTQSTIRSFDVGVELCDADVDKVILFVILFTASCEYDTLQSTCLCRLVLTAYPAFNLLKITKK